MNRTEAHLALSREWLEEIALPFWAGPGRDDVHGGFYENVDTNGRPVRSRKRVRVQFRQIYCYAKAGQMGYRGPWRDAVSHGLNFVFDKGLHPNGLSRHALDEAGVAMDAITDLYDQAFMLLGLAEAYKATGDHSLKAAAHRAAGELFERLKHPRAGFWDSLHDKSVLRTNPHMHLLEASIAWLAAEPRGVWREIGQMSVDLCRSTFMHPKHGGLLEVFDADWTPLSSGEFAVIEPGHMFEWAWLLLKWNEATGEDTLGMATRLYDAAIENGLCPDRDVAINALDLDLKPADTVARLWPQTERLKASLALAAHPGARGHDFMDHVRRADASLGHYFKGLPPGVWRDKSNPDGSFKQEPVPASSFYHLLCAAYERLGATN